MTDYTFYNGKITTYDSASVPLYDRSLFFGEGVYDVILGQGERLFQLEEHLDRLFNNANALSIPHNYSKAGVEEIITALISSAKPDGCFTVYIQMSRSSCRRCHVHTEADGANLLITVCAFNDNGKYEISLVSCEDVRYKLCNIKTVNLLPSVMAANYARSRGADEAVFVRDGIVTECSHSNLFILSDGILITHPADEYILNGIMRQNLLRTAEELGIPTAEEKFTLEQIKCADEVFVTSTTAFAKRCLKLDGIPLPQRQPESAKKLTSILKESFFKQN